MLKLFNEYKNSGKIKETLLVGKNMVNKNPSDSELFRAYMDWLLFFAEKLPVIEERRDFVNQANVVLAFFEENADLTGSLINEINAYQNKIDSIMQNIETEIDKQNKNLLQKIREQNNTVIKKLYDEKQKLSMVKTQRALEENLLKIKSLDEQIDHEYMTEAQILQYAQISKQCTDEISEKMKEIELDASRAYNKKAVEAYETAFNKFKNGENTYKNNQGKLFSLVSSTLFAYDASQLFNESLIYYNHVYSFIFSRLNDDGKFALTRFSLECERKKKVI